MLKVAGRFVLLALVVSLLGLPAPAFAQGAPTVTLKASDKSVNFGRSMLLTGKITPATGDQEVHIVDENARILGSTTTKDDGTYKVRVAPKRNAVVRAEWAGTFSDRLHLWVRPLLDVEAGDVRLFDRTKVRGQIKPGNVNRKVRLELRLWGEVVKTRNAEPKAGGWFKARFRVPKPGGYRIVASYKGNDYQSAAAKTGRRSTPLPSLSSGADSVFVQLLERRLRKLHYRVPVPNRHFDHRTSDGLIAFNKVQGRPRVGYVTESTWRALANPRIPKPRFNSPKYHIEVDQTKQVLYRVKNGKVITIMHVSTGAGNATRDGTFQVWSKLAGYSRKRLYYPSFFDGARGIHGWPSVPTYNASHGCVRVPMWTAIWIFERIENGQTIRIYH